MSLSHGNATFLHILERFLFLRVEFCTNLSKMLQLSISMNKLLILRFWLNYLFNKPNSLRKKNGRNFLTSAEEMKDFIGVNYIMAGNQYPSICIGLRSFRRQRWHSEYLYKSKIQRSLTKPSLYRQHKTRQNS